MSNLNQEFMEQLRQAAGSAQVLEMEQMARHTTFRVGGPCDCFVSPSEISQIRAIIEVCKANGVPWYVIGNGSNLLVSDEGYRGVMIHLGAAFSGYQIDAESGKVTVQAGAGLGGLVRDRKSVV